MYVSPVGRTPRYVRVSTTPPPKDVEKAARESDDTDDHEPDEADETDEEGRASESAAAGAPAVREGLPPSYRMRHEPHYVDALVGLAAPSAPAVTAAAAPAVAAEPPAPRDTSPRTPLEASAALADAFEAIELSLRDVPMRGQSLRARVAIELARAEATRGRWLAQSAVVMRVDPMPALDDVDLVSIMRTVIEALGPESRLTGGGASAPALVGDCRVFGDERLLTTAIGSSLAALRMVAEVRGDARKVTLNLVPRVDASMHGVEISQRAVRVSEAALARFFDAEWADHPAGASGALLLAAANRIAAAHGGALDVAATDGGGCRLLLTLPAAD